MKHVLRSTVLSILHMGVMFFLLSVFLHHEGLFQAFFVQQPSVYAGLVFFGCSIPRSNCSPLGCR